MTERELLHIMAPELIENIREAQAALLDALHGNLDDSWRERATVAEINLDSVRRFVELTDD